jgi:hypothetical protein
MKVLIAAPHLLERGLPSTFGVVAAWVNMNGLFLDNLVSIAQKG